MLVKEGVKCGKPQLEIGRTIICVYDEKMNIQMKFLKCIIKRKLNGKKDMEGKIVYGRCYTPIGNLDDITCRAVKGF